MAPDTATKQVAQFTKVISHIHEIVNKAREEWDVESSRSGVQQTNSLTDTHALVAAVGMGKGLMGLNAGPMSAGMMIPPAIRPAGAIPGSSSGPAMGKAPSAIKTNIKSANQIHPYGR